MNNIFTFDKLKRFVKTNWLEIILLILTIIFSAKAFFVIDNCCSSKGCSQEMKAMWLIMLGHIIAMLKSH